MLSLVSETTSKSSGGSSLFLFAIMGVVIVMIIRGQRRRKKAAVEVASAIVPGAEIVTAGGQFGTVTDVVDNVVHVEVAPGVVVRYVAGAIARVINSPALPEDEFTPSLES